MKTPARRVGRWFAVAGAVGFWALGYVYLTLPDVRPLAIALPTTTAFMELRAREAAAGNRPYRRSWRPIPYRRIAPVLRRAVVTAEDDAFFQHDGIDLTQLRVSLQTNLERFEAARGGSTITQQLAKNLYLSPSRNPLRKFRELLIARRLEAALGKARILELYLNVIEWGDGVWGAEAAARTHFGVSASAVDAAQAALLAGAIVNPRQLSPRRPSARLLRRQRLILSRMGRTTPRRRQETPVALPTPDVVEATPQNEEDDGRAERTIAPAELPAQGDSSSQ